MLKIAISKEAHRALSRIPKNLAGRIEAKIEQYAAAPASLANNVKRLKGGRHFRLRVGDWRVIFDVKAATMIVVDVGPRGGVYDE